MKAPVNILNDLVFLSVLASVAILAVAEITHSAMFGYARIPIGIYFVVFPAGFLFISALFPKKGELSYMERLALGMASGIAIETFIVIITNIFLSIPFSLGNNLWQVGGFAFLSYFVFNLRARFWRQNK